ncbi:MAG: hypothetical protein D3906_16150, partial [Candidatus Electrothrix sp. AUS1_2]|nr:hypothetical protein [Candidatus Electrothrix sp. AUS1_2]
MKKITGLILFTLLTLLSAGTSKAVEITVLGPVKYTRTAGENNVFSDSFRAIPKQGKLHVRNGDGIRKGQISSAWVQVNGAEIFTPADFNQKVFSLEAPVNLLEDNSINIELSSKPGSYLEVWVTVDVPLPTAALTLTPQSIIRGESAELSWTTEHAESCSITPGLGKVSLNSSTTVSPVETATYTINCTNLGGSVSESTTLTVFQPPTVSLSADPVSIIAGDSSTLSWTSTNADSVTITPDIGSVSANGTQSVSPSETTTYEITASGAGGTATETVTVEVLAADPTITISADPETIALGTSTLLSWQSDSVDTVHIDNGIGTVAANDSLSVTPEHTTTYTITGSGAGGTVSAQVTVQVT